MESYRQASSQSLKSVLVNILTINIQNLRISDHLYSAITFQTASDSLKLIRTQVSHCICFWNGTECATTNIDTKFRIKSGTDYRINRFLRIIYFLQIHCQILLFVSEFWLGSVLYTRTAIHTEKWSWFKSNI